MLKIVITRICISIDLSDLSLVNMVNVDSPEYWSDFYSKVNYCVVVFGKTAVCYKKIVRLAFAVIVIISVIPLEMLLVFCVPKLTVFICFILIYSPISIFPFLPNLTILVSNVNLSP